MSDSDISTPKLILGALSLTAALAWNEAASSGIRAIVPAQKSTFAGQLIYAIIVTLVIIVVAYGVRRITDGLSTLKNEAEAETKIPFMPGRAWRR